MSSSHPQTKWSLNRTQFFKTRICPFHISGKRCTKGDSCSYAHSIDELCPSINLSKTKFCEAFKKGQCHMNAEECRFCHSFEELRSTPHYYKMTMCSSWLMGNCSRGHQCRYAHGLNEVRWNPFEDQAGVPSEILAGRDRIVPSTPHTRAIKNKKIYNGNKVSETKNQPSLNYNHINNLSINYSDSTENYGENKNFGKDRSNQIDKNIVATQNVQLKLYTSSPFTDPNVIEQQQHLFHNQFHPHIIKEDSIVSGDNSKLCDANLVAIGEGQTAPNFLTNQQQQLMMLLMSQQQKFNSMSLTLDDDNNHNSNPNSRTSREQIQMSNQTHVLQFHPMMMMMLLQNNKNIDFQKSNVGDRVNMNFKKNNRRNSNNNRNRHSQNVNISDSCWYQSDHLQLRESSLMSPPVNSILENFENSRNHYRNNPNREGFQSLQQTTIEGNCGQLTNKTIKNRNHNKKKRRHQIFENKNHVYNHPAALFGNFQTNYSNNNFINTDVTDFQDFQPQTMSSVGSIHSTMIPATPASIASPLNMNDGGITYNSNNARNILLNNHNLQCDLTYK